MADVFEDNRLLEPERRKLWNLIEKTPLLDWLLLTKRPENMTKLAPWGKHWPKNVWALATVENQDYAEQRIPHLLEVPAVVRGLSVEPMLGPVNLSLWITDINWVIAGGESGAGSRPMNPEWTRDLRDQCLEAGAAFFFKQWGNWIPSTSESQGIGVKFSSSTGTEETHYMKRVAKKIAGQRLDGFTWNQLPHHYLIGLDTEGDLVP